ncbi:MAG: GAF domain-containing protein [Anaerolineales bacterium]|uniref:sensor histidine kinase n=1 Tax=Candidatus Villigracilis proximus TaxID=3140683 RepID=UPI003135EAC8|nr:GAF domain-containing protein [Anaerolineales bacterium]MBK8821613.1 GAF domain-containing protein [Anaerolineales bacterium]MBK9211051.1 GAF domain-containing protein [Anaerolineales bacterium]
MAEIKTERLDGYRRLVDIARDLASTLDLDILLSRIVHAAAEISGSEAASILLYDDTSRQLYFQVSTNMDESMRRGLIVPLDGSIAGWIVNNRKPVRITNAHDDPRFFSNIEETTGFSTESLLGIPLVTKNKIVGVLEALNKNKGKFSDADESMLLVLGAQAAVAIENARLFQQSDLISEFVHELRTPLASLSTATYLLLRPEMSQEQRDQIIHNIHSETMRLNALASSFLDLARLESGRVQFRKTVFSVADLIYECKDVMASKATDDNIQIRVESPEGLPLLEADRDKIKQVLLNLLSNAIKYNRPNGTVMLRAEALEDEMVLYIQDTGVGIPDESVPHLFEKFFRVREHEARVAGTGLGLSICKQIIHGHGGRVEVKSKIGVGTVFSVFLPRPSRTQPHIEEVDDVKQTRKKG